ncbi:MAG: hypothetical protein HC903_26820 [Methylacidiphilales bacterium]|nr:hypothetical protein [Candidatus Methylacidiphilales bacterium]NJR15270.1 hypothetical protein [Calothrix sp. CSU_2_0]
MTIELGYFQQQGLVEKLTRRFAKINGYKIEKDLNVLDATHPQIQTWSVMAEAAIEELVNALNGLPENETVRNFLAKHNSETHTGEEWEKLAAAEGLNKDDINELMNYLDDYH